VILGLVNNRITPSWIKGLLAQALRPVLPNHAMAAR
jgi:hypothetical protein